ncbi:MULTISPECIES: hypothetical protein [Robiginitalea]|uniref:DUF4252 domain-containing protein n=1 Tax=Robiginitalea biformata (strain ATCC BAA-864 / DSM 15991 / KCTC 12146 / HTCC2501) TaxID=313596 RepID=A4CMW1_ROBBH|nr:MULTISPECIES: hypothetical protein [Robiginitalea]EAR15003.1 hypothetical protein RB2501_11772 [Robiginitalea biformata HTCC2501]MDC6355181.1 hypothetical protein [Robiginitalea sp. PM2]MDC6375604.1 hypothetical protein [Robiginitalea sp. SP8]
MKNLLVAFLIIAGTANAVAQKNIFQSNRFDELSQDHQVLAIIPFFTHLDLDEELSRSEKHRLEQKEGYAVQDALETYFGRGKKRKKFSVDFQNSKDTNALLAQNDISYDNIDRYTIRELADILGVDGIISGNLDVNVLLSDGVPSDFSFLDYLLGDADYGRIGIKISDGKSGKLIWKYEQEISRKSGKDTDDLIDKMMKKAARKFPYDKEGR